MNYTGLDIGSISNKVRQVLLSQNYVEVVSPIIRGSDSAINKRFRVLNVESCVSYLRDCMETPLRKFTSMTVPKIFEIGPCFRQGENDETHRQEFYMMELYSVGEGLAEMRSLTSRILSSVRNRDIPSQVISIKDIIFSEFGLQIGATSTDELVRKIADKYGYSLSFQSYQVMNKYIEEKEGQIFVEQNRLYFLEDYPVCTIDSAARIHNQNIIQRFEAYYNGLEIAHAFVDCLDADDIAHRASSGSTLDDEKEELINLTKNYFLSPTVGLGIGIDRLCMIDEGEQ
jgi:lysyl-tRNA synthetase class II